MYTVVLPMTNNVQGKSLRISMSSTLSNVWDILVVTNVHCITLSYILLPGNCHYKAMYIVHSHIPAMYNPDISLDTFELQNCPNLR